MGLWYFTGKQCNDSLRDSFENSGACVYLEAKVVRGSNGKEDLIMVSLMGGDMENLPKVCH